MKVATIVGTRPEIIKLSRVIAELDAHCSHVLIHTGQNYDYSINQVFFDQLGIRKPDHFLEVASGDLGETIGNVIARSYRVLESEAPQALLLLGDTNSCLSAISAKRLKIPVFHMEAGNRCFDERVPEEINRRIVDHISDINLTYTEHARRYLLSEGLPPDRVLKTGSPMREVLTNYRDGIDSSEVMTRLGLEPQRFLLVSVHREENVDVAANLNQLLAAFRALRERYQMPVIVSTHPRTRLRLDQLGVGQGDGAIQFIEALGFLDYVNLQMNAYCVLSDSGTITEEASILNFPAVTIRQAHERPEGMDEATLVMSGLQPAGILEAVELVVKQHSRSRAAFRRVPDYEPDNVSKKVVRLIFSYTDYVNRVVWRKVDPA